MKNLLPATAGLLTLILTSCSTDFKQSLLQPNPQLVSPNGVRIAESAKELEQLANLMTKKGFGKVGFETDSVINITKVDYVELSHSPKNSVAAIVHYRTVRGMQGSLSLNFSVTEPTK